MPFEIYPLNIIISILVLMPNILFFILKPINVPKDENKKPVWGMVSALENIGRIAVSILPLFWRVTQIGGNKTKIIILFLMIISLSFYYFGWIRYFSSNREYKLLFEPMLFIPLPMAIFPIIFLFLSGLLINSTPIIIATMIFAFFHVTESWRIKLLCSNSNN